MAVIKKPPFERTMKNPSLVERILQSVFFKNAEEKAYSYARNTQRITDLIRSVSAKSSRMEGSEGSDLSFLDHVRTLMRMLLAYKRGEYKTIPWKSLVLIIATLVYFVSPFDFIPDLLPIVGVSDDIALVLWVVKSLKDDIMDFRTWELNSATRAVEVE